MFYELHFLFSHNFYSEGLISFHPRIKLGLRSFRIRSLLIGYATLLGDWISCYIAILVGLHISDNDGHTRNPKEGAPVLFVLRF